MPYLQSIKEHIDAVIYLADHYPEMVDRLAEPVLKLLGSGQNERAGEVIAYARRYFGDGYVDKIMGGPVCTDTELLHRQRQLVMNVMKDLRNSIDNRTTTPADELLLVKDSLVAIADILKGVSIDDSGVLDAVHHQVDP